MSLVIDDKLAFSRDQIVSSSVASKNFGEIRRRAAKAPQFVSGRSGIDTVVIGFDEFERMCLELDRLRQERLYAMAADRLEEPPARIALRDVMDEDAYSRLLAMDPDAIPDEELFE